LQCGKDMYFDVMDCNTLL